MSEKSKIYTKTGDQGKTSLLGGARVNKNHPRVEAYGSVDELNASLGLARSFNEIKEVDDLLLSIQNELFDIGTELSNQSERKVGGKNYFVTEEKIAELERAIDHFDAQLPKLTNFILPFGTKPASFLHLGRTICRRAERKAISLNEKEELNPNIIKYLNRLSDLLFVLARFANHMGKTLFGNTKLKLFVTIFLSALVLAVIAFFIFKHDAVAPSKNKVASLSAQPLAKKSPEIPKLTLANIFATASASLAELDQSKVITLIATGDVIPARGANYPAVKSGNFHYNWEKTADFLKAGDITLINLEAPLIKDCPLISTGFTFCGSSRHIEGITWAGVDVASLANNHIGNFGPSGISETEQLLSSNGVEYSGFGHLGIKEVKGVKFGFLSYNGIGTTIDREGMANEIKAARPQVDVLIVSVHWGKEYESYPMTDGNIAPDNPIELGHLMIDSGADLVIGNHPHWVQGVELYKGRLITYAHGNFIFDQTWSEETQEGVVGTYTFYDKQLVSVHYTPIKVDINYQPYFVTGTTSDTIIQRMVDSSHQLAKQQGSQE